LRRLSELTAFLTCSSGAIGVRVILSEGWILSLSPVTTASFVPASLRCRPMTTHSTWSAPRRVIELAQMAQSAATFSFW